MIIEQNMMWESCIKEVFLNPPNQIPGIYLLFKFQSFIYFLPARVVAWWYGTLTQLSGGRWFESQEVL